jgi:hypothetical protein
LKLQETVMATKKKNPLVTAGTLLPLALGLAMNAAGPSTSTRSNAHRGSLEPGSQACVSSLSECTLNGCATDNNPDEELLNHTKRHLPASSTPKVLTLADFTTLQNQADSTVGQKQPLDAAARAQLANIQVSSGETVSEGDAVQVDGYLVGKPHPNTGESVNCNLKGPANNDFHIPFADDPDKTPFEGIVVEMIPQNRPSSWSIKNLSKAENARLKVRIVGQLFYDNMHEVNPDQDESKSGQPPRFSLWEVHPITAFSVCPKTDGNCTSASDWQSLEAYAGEAAK